MPAEDAFCPYVGLQPYNPQDSDYFFGRERQQAVVTSNLFAAPLTVLYGAGGSASLRCCARAFCHNWAGRSEPRHSISISGRTRHSLRG